MSRAQVIAFMAAFVAAHVRGDRRKRRELMAKKRCEHSGTATVLLSNGEVKRDQASMAFLPALCGPRPISAKCDDCAAQLAAGRARGKPNVLELRAASLIVSRGKYAGRINSRLLDEDEGSALIACAILRGSNPSAHAIAQGMPERGAAGWLAYEIATHDEQRAEERICEQTRHDVAASVARHADLSPGDAFMARTADMERITGDEARAVVGGQHLPSTGRVPYAEDQLPLPAVNLTPPHHVELEISVGDEPEQGIEVEIVDVDDDALIAEIASAPPREPKRTVAR